MTTIAMALAFIVAKSGHGLTIEIKVQSHQGQALEGFQAYWIHDQTATRLAPGSGGVLSVSKPVGVVVVAMAGYQYAGVRLDPSQPVSTISLRRTEDTAARVYRTRGHPIAAELRTQLLNSIEGECWETVHDARRQDISPYAFQLLGQIVPERTLQYLSENQVEQNAAGMARQAIIRSLAKTDIEAAIEALDADLEPMIRSFLLSELLHSLPFDHASLDVIETQFADIIREIDQPAMRLASWAMLGEHYILKGEPEKAGQIVDQHLADVKKLPSGGWTGFPRSLFAALIVNDDLPLATDLIQGIDQDEQARAIGRLAFFACQAHPHTAVSLLATLDKGNLIGYPYTTSVVSKVARSHPGVAFDLTAGIPEAKHQAWAHGLICERLIDLDPAQAKDALKRARKNIEDACQEKIRTHISPGEILAGLLPIAETVEPEMLESMIWQSLWASIPHSRWREGSETFAVQLESVAAAIARYDEQLGSSLTSLPMGDRRPKFDARRAINHAALDADGLLQRIAGEDFSAQNLRGFEALTLSLTGDGQAFWDLASLPNLLNRPTERFEQ